MARTNIEVIITVKDGASAPLDKVNNKIKQTSSATKQATADFWQFNKAVFTTTAFIGTFVKAFSGFKSSLDLGGDLDRLVNQYEKVLGPSGKLFSAIDSMTTTSIDRMEALRAGVALKGLGISGSTEQIAEIVAKAGTAAKMAGIEAGEGVKHFTEFLKDGSVSHLEHLHLIKRTDASFQLYLDTLHSSVKVGGTMLSTQAKLAIGMELLSKKTQGMLMQAQDLKDITDGLRFSFDWLKRTVGSFLGAAIGPLLAKIIPLIYKFTATLELLKKNNKEILFLTRTFILATAAILGTVSAIGSFRLLVKLLGFAGMGVPALTTGILILTGAFLGLTNKTEGVVNKLKVLGAFFKGIYELVTNLDPETGMSKISESTKKLLQDAGIYGFVKMIARVIVIVKTVLVDLYKAAVRITDVLDKLFGGVFHKLFQTLGKFTQNWTTWWTSDAISDIEKTKRALITLAGVIGGLFVGKKIFDVAKLGLSKIPIIGRFFGGNDGSSPSKPLFVKEVTKMWAGKLMKQAGKVTEDIFEALGLRKLQQIFLRVLSPSLEVFIGYLSRVAGFLGVIGGTILPFFISSIYGFIQGVTETSSEWGKFFKGIFDLGSALFKSVEKFTGIYWILKWAYGGFKNIGSQLELLGKFFGKILDFYQFLFKSVMSGWKNIGELAGTYAGVAGEKMSAAGKYIENLSSNKQTAVSVPDVPVDQESAIREISTALRGLSGAERDRTRDALKSAFSESSADADKLTWEEIRNIVHELQDSNEILARIEASSRSSALKPKSDRRSK